MHVKWLGIYMLWLNILLPQNYILVSYNSPRIAAELIKEHSIRSQEAFQKTTSHLSSNCHDIRAMITKGFLQSIAQSAVQNELMDVAPLIQKGIPLCFVLFNVSEKDTEHTLLQLEKLNIESHVKSFLFPSS